MPLPLLVATTVIPFCLYTLYLLFRGDKKVHIIAPFMNFVPFVCISSLLIQKFDANQYSGRAVISQQVCVVSNNAVKFNGKVIDFSKTLPYNDKTELEIHYMGVKYRGWVVTANPAYFVKTPTGFVVLD